MRLMYIYTYILTVKDVILWVRCIDEVLIGMLEMHAHAR